jgi:hypothetical protein
VSVSFLTIGLAANAFGQSQNPNDPSNRRSKPLPRQAPQTLRTGGGIRTFQGWRSGYSPSPQRFNRRTFAFHRYVLDYADTQAILLSPFYFYSNLPPFIQEPSSPDQVADTDSGTNSGESDTGELSNSTSNSPSSPSAQDSSESVTDSDSDGAVEDLRKAWTSLDTAALEKLCPKSGNVKVSVADQTYDLNAADFANLIQDGVNGTLTASWKIADMHANDTEVDLRVIHKFSDSSGNLRSVVQTYTLVDDGSGFLIREFGSEPYVDVPAGPPANVSSGS